MVGVDHSICSRCGGTDFRRDGKRKYPWGEKQKLICKGCGKRTVMASWLSFDRKVYDKHKVEQFNQFLESKAEYDKAKTQLGSGGFQVDDL